MANSDPSYPIYERNRRDDLNRFEYDRAQFLRVQREMMDEPNPMRIVQAQPAVSVDLGRIARLVELFAPYMDELELELKKGGGLVPAIRKVLPQPVVEPVLILPDVVRRKRRSITVVTDAEYFKKLLA